MDIIKFNGISYNVLIKDLSENFTILYSENTGRTISDGARMTLDPLGTFIGHKVTFGCKSGFEAQYDALYEFLLEPRYDGIEVEIVHLQDKIKYEAYVSQGERKVKSINPHTEKVYYGEFSVNIVPMEAQVVPQ